MIKFDEIRSSFIDFFKKNDHHHIDSSSLIPSNDPTLLFTNAGMVQFKNYFTGLEIPEKKNVVTSQKCIRAGGKHNDLDNVGYTSRHHTFFEMLGNFSFGNYFKENAINLAWNFLIKDCAIDPKKLIITVYEKDEESYKLWKKISNFSDSKILRINTDDNFWSMGDTGPCGPCSEIFFDNGEKIPGGLPGSKSQDGQRYVEIWNLVFMEFERKNNELLSLPKKCVDTGMGLERISAVLNGKTNNYEIDIFLELIRKIEIISEIKLSTKNFISFRVVADHIRSIVFLISEGILPSNEGRGYVLRRIIRRASRHSSLIGYEKPLLYLLVKLVIKNYGSVYYDLLSQQNFIVETLKIEEEKFLETLKDGLKLLNNELKALKNNLFPAELAFKLYDTYGFPVDMTQNIVIEKKLKFDNKRLDQLITDQKNKSKKSWQGSGENIKSDFYIKLKEDYKPTIFLGYNSFTEEAKLLAIIKDENFLNESSDEDDLVLIFDKTPFYGESGGQIGDIGEIFSLDGKEKVCNIYDTKKEDNIYLHFSKNLRTKLEVGKNYKLSINFEKRVKARNNHTATHLLHESLRRVLGDHIKQKGSLVSSEKLRFDFTHNKAMSNEELENVENIVNSTIRDNLDVSTNIMKTKDAIKGGAIALFGEKYPEEARVVNLAKIGSKHRIFSSELCGGTHVDSTGEIGSVKILTETSVASGVRRIEAITGIEVDIFNRKQNNLISKLRDILKSNEENILKKIENIISENQRLTKSSKSAEADVFQKKYLSKVDKYNLYVHLIDRNPKELKSFCDSIKLKIISGIIIVVTNYNNKPTIVVSITDDINKKLSAIKVSKEISFFLGGKGGGGRDDMAQAGGSVVKTYDEIYKFSKNLVQTFL